MKLVVTGGYWLRGVTGDSAFKMKANVTNKQTPRWHYIKINQIIKDITWSSRHISPPSHRPMSVSCCTSCLLRFAGTWLLWLF